MSTMNVLDAAGLTVAVEKPLVPGQALMAASRPVAIASDQSAIPVSGTVSVSGTIPVSGTFWQATQPVSGTITANAGTGTFAISAASLPLPTGAATAAKQPALGTAGTAATDVLTVQGIASMTALKVDGSAVTQPISGSLTNISGTISLPTGAATSANQTTLNTAIGSSADSVLTTGGSGSHSSYLRTIMEQTLSTAASSVKIDQTTPGTTDAVTVKQPADVISFTPTLDTAAYASGDVLFATTSLGTVMRANDGRALLISLTGIDKSKNKPAMTLLFYQTNVTSAAANAANALSDADQANLLGYVRILAADWIDYANNSITCKTSINLLLEAVSGAQNVYVVGILDAGTPTFAASDLVFKLGVVQS